MLVKRFVGNETKFYDRKNGVKIKWEVTQTDGDRDTFSGNVAAGEGEEDRNEGSIFLHTAETKAVIYLLHHHLSYKLPLVCCFVGVCLDQIRYK